MSVETFVALVTCFAHDETINYAATRAQVRRQIEAGNHILCCGTNGDFTALTFEEKSRLAQEVIDEVAGQVKVIVNVGTPSTYETRLLAQQVAALGVDGLAIVTPYFIACSQDGLVRHFSAIADSVEKPVYLYNIPARTQNSIEPETAMKLAAHGNIVGIKDSSGHKESLAAYLAVAKINPGFDVYSGTDSLVLWSLENGARGCISGLGNVQPELYAEIRRAFVQGRNDDARAAQEQFTALRADLYALGYPPAMVKRALYLMDESVGASRQPALLADAKLDAALAKVLKAHGLEAGFKARRGERASFF